MNCVSLCAFASLRLIYCFLIRESSHLQKLIKSIASTFQQIGIEHPKRQAEELLCQFFQCKRGDLYVSTLSLTEMQLSLIQSWVQQRCIGVPLAYISGYTEFYGCHLSITPDVLIPRQETEILVDTIVSHLKSEDYKGKELWDLCCGSGCIGIAIKRALPDLKVVLSDISPEAIDIAEKNARNNQVVVECLRGDLFLPFNLETAVQDAKAMQDFDPQSLLMGAEHSQKVKAAPIKSDCGSKDCVDLAPSTAVSRLIGRKADYIISNPPYISKADYLSLDREVRDFEPSLALIGGATGLEFYERFAQDLPFYLKKGGKCWFETGYDQGNAIKNLFKKPFYKQIKCEKDWAGHDRFFFLEIE